jgi:predicted O-linked N-acetylglucosamine transferase (SPINDLY family)
MRNFEKQKHERSLIGCRRARLHHLLLKSIFFEDFEIKVRFNPKCIRSSDAKADDLSERRPDDRMKNRLKLARLFRRKSLLKQNNAESICYVENYHGELLICSQLVSIDDTTTNTSRHIVCQ